MEEKGRLTGKELREAVESICDTDQTNCKAYFEIHPDAAEALILDPALALYNGEGPGSQSIKPFWQHLSERTQNRALGRWKKGRPVSLQWMIDDCTRVIALKPDYVNAWVNRGAARGRLGDWLGAVNDYTRAIELQPDFAEAWLARGVSRGSWAICGARSTTTSVPWSSSRARRGRRRSGSG